MKAIQFEITLLKKRYKISRTLLVSKKVCYEKLHGMMQLLFNLDHAEEYFFKKKSQVYSFEQGGSTTLMKIKKGDELFYVYDAMDSLKFSLKAVDVLESEEYAKCIGYHGKNLYETVGEKIDTARQSNFDIQWVNRALRAYDEAYDAQFDERFEATVSELIRIRYFQDYLHNQIVKIALPCGRSSYMGADASEDVIINFHINGDKLSQYTSVQAKIPSQSAIKYHDCIECSIIKKIKEDVPEDFDYCVGTYGIILSYANVFYDEQLLPFHKELYLTALEKYVRVISYCSEHEIKFEYGKMLEIDENEQISVIDGRLTVMNIEYLGKDTLQRIASLFKKRKSICEVDVLTLFETDESIMTKCIVGSKNDFLEKTIYNASVKTMLKNIFDLLLERWQLNGMDGKILLRDNNLYRPMKYICDYLKIKCELKAELKEIDHAYLSSSLKMMGDMNPKEIILKLLEELGISPTELEGSELNADGVLTELLFKDDSKKYS